MFRYLASSIALAAVLVWPGAAQESGSHDKNLDVRSPIGDLHVGKDADAKSAGLPLYPGARPKYEKDNDPLNFGVLTESFGFKLVVAKYESEDAPGKVIDYYREHLKKYGKVVECYARDGSGDAHAEFNGDKHSKELKCESDNTGPVTQLKVGTEDNQHVVAIEPNNGRSGTTFTLVYVHTRGNQDDI
ncbi:MAG: hypothetical protein WAM69_18250 [Candidatus Sulfotelmatobacter sp.]